MESCITLTFCECSENHVGMEKNGKLSSVGYSADDLDSVIDKLNGKFNIERYNLLDYLKKDDYVGKIPELLVIRNYIDFHENLYESLININWDRKYYDNRRQKVLNKHARANLCFGHTHSDADFENKKGTIVAYSSIANLDVLKNNVEGLLNDSNLQCEGNLYDDIEKNGIGWHGDAERRKVVGVRLGKSAPLKFRWYKNSVNLGETLNLVLNSGDLYIMTEKTTGNDWKRRNIYTLRHSAIATKYTK